MTWIKSNRLWLVFNSSAAAMFIYTLSLENTHPYSPNAILPELESGKWAVRFLLVCLTMSPLKMCFNWNPGIKLRKSAGLWSFGFACLHVIFEIRETQFSWFTLPMPAFIVLGLVGSGILTALAITSNRLAMRTLRKNWKRLHRFVYLAGGSVVVHAMLAAITSKKMLIRDPEPIHELRVYLGILIVLLVVRIPLLRRWLKNVRLPRKNTPVPVVEMYPVPSHFPPAIQASKNGDSHAPAVRELPKEPVLEDEAEALEMILN